MKKLYYAAIICCIMTSCSKDFLKSYEDRIEGTWRIVDVDRRGFGGSISNLPFQGGTFTFDEGGTLTYVNDAGDQYQGSWDIRNQWMSGDCYTTEDGNTSCDDKRVQSLSITAINFTTQDVRTEFFDDIIFTGTNRFKAFIYSGAHTYVFKFRR